MSFLDEIKTRNINLRPVQTRITNPDGKVYLETISKGTGKVAGSVSGNFYVIDSRPDEGLHEVIPKLFVGSQDAASNLNGLKEHGISHILNVAGVTTAQLDHIIYKYLPLYDVPDFNIAAHFKDAIHFINEGLQRGAVLVHCNAGISRSTTITIAYLMKEIGHTLESAFQLVKKARLATRPNPGFMKQLKAFENELLIKPANELKIT